MGAFFFVFVFAVVASIIVTDVEAFFAQRTSRSIHGTVSVAATKQNSQSTNPFASLFKSKNVKTEKKMLKTIVVPKNYNVAAGFGAIAVVVGLIGHNYAAGATVAAIAAFLALQSGKVRFVFDNEALEVLISKGEEDVVDSMEKSRGNEKVH